MLLLEIKAYIEAQKEVTLPRLAAHFNIPESVALDMAERWVTKGKIEKITVACSTLTSGCGDCGSSSCAVKTLVTPKPSQQILYRAL
ncbi:Hypothetical protein F387_00977 [Wohlfahrtiimonas chitiniclastica SH04]|uniref:Transcriptional regulator HTH-type FeoC domain-containing protein n=1 Tax=Wohlfahrtiimonas chitiniclastica SH04 TaxID=1261130 RepID=L8Y2C0_9GAMM|nr:FeoC-like transcriptional regulator [Wohlfahrtiimonas chitiniclastica]ELV09085.1 Hypothetical protein F387_00977 [Wohlfahrtiimonas chitiniclastica SH04]